MRGYKLGFFFFMYLLLTILLTGCWDSKELEDQFLVWGMGWDVVEDDPHLLAVSLSSPSIAEKAEKPYVFVTSTGHSVEEARKNIQKQLQRTIEMGHIRILTIGQEFAKRGIVKYLDSIGRNPRIGRETKIIVSDCKAADIWSLKHPSNVLPADYLVKLINTNAQVGLVSNLTFRDFFEALSTEGKEPVAIYIRMAKDKSMFNVAGLAAFKEDKMVGTLLDKEVQAYKLIVNDTNDGTFTVGQVTDPGGEATTFAYRRGGAKIKTEVLDDIPHIFIDVYMEGDIIEYTSTKPIADPKNIELAQKAIETRVKSIIENVVQKAQKEFNSDIFGFGLYFKAYHNQYWQTHDWNLEFANVVVHVEVKCDIRRVGIES